MPALVLVNGEEDFLMERAARDEASASLAEDVFEYRLPGQLEAYAYDSQAPIEPGRSRAFILWDAASVPVMPEGEKDILIAVAASARKPLSDPRAKRVHNFPKLKGFDDNNEVIKWSLKEGDRFNIDLSRVAAALFVSCGNCPRKISSEIEKLSVLTPRGSTVSPDVARSVLCFSAELNPRQVVDAICDGHTAKALAFYDKLQEANDETGWIIAFMQRHVLQCLRVEALAESGASADSAASVLGVHPFVYRKTLLPRRGLWTKQSLSRSIDTLCEMDVAHKRGSDSARFCLETEIIRLSEEAKDVKQRR